MSRECVQLLLAAAPFDETQQNFPFQSVHDLLELGFKDFRMLGNLKFANCQLKEKFHKRAKFAVSHLSPGLELCNGVLSSQVQHLELLYEVHGGRWSSSGDLDPNGFQCASEAMQQLVKSHNFLVQEVCSSKEPSRSSANFVRVGNKTVTATGVCLKVNLFA